MGKKMTLNKAKNAQTVRVLEITGDAATRSLLNQIGIHPDDIIRVVRRAAWGGPLLVENRDTSVAISRSVAHRIVVEAVE